MKEKWIQICQIQGYEEIREYYWLSNSDEDVIVNIDTNREIRPRIGRHGYPSIKLRTIEGKTKIYKMHILKAKAFIYGPNPLDATLVRHLNDVKTDNRLENLAFGTRSNNAQDAIKNSRYNYEAAVRGGIKGGKINGAIRAKKTSKPVRCLETGITYLSAYEVERQIGISNSKINLCCNGKRHTAGGYHWEFVNKEVNNDDVEREQIR